MKKKKDVIVVAIPTIGPHNSEISLKLARFLTNLKAPRGYDLKISFSFKNPVDANRNRIVKNFLEDKQNKWLVMIDSDNVPPDNILDIIKLNKPVVSATVMGMQNGIPHPLVMKMNSKKMYTMVNLSEINNEVDKDGLIEVDGVGCGCIVIRRDVLEKIKSNWFRFQYNDWGDIAYSEDYSFSQKVKKNKFKIYVSVKHICEHYKTVGLWHINHLLYQAATLQMQTRDTWNKLTGKKMTFGKRHGKV